jgi:hypothetical protein
MRSVETVSQILKDSRRKPRNHKLERYSPLGHHLMKSGLLIALMLLFAVALFGQEPARPSQDPKPAIKADETKRETSKTAEKPDFTLSVKTKPILNLSLKAQKIKLVDIATEMAKRLRIPVFVSPVLQKELVSIEFTSLTLEPAMQLMAPAVYIDYEIETGSGIPPKPLGIFFYDASAAEPPDTAVVAGASQSLLFEGDTEEGVEPKTEEDRKKVEEQPLRVHFQNNVLSVKAKQQPLVVVLLKIGEELGIPVEIQYETKDTVDIEFTKLPVEDAVRRLSPNIRLFLRANLLHAERRALRLVLADPAKTAQQGL